jgi:lipopolysaccharide transport system permease protein
MTTVLESVSYAWRSRRAWWFTATARSKARFARTALGSFWLGFSNLLSIAPLSVVYGTIFKVQDFDYYVVFLGTGLAIWNAISASASSTPVLFDYNSRLLKNTNINPIFYTLEEWAFQLQTFLQSLVIVLLALSYYQPSLYPHLFSAGLLPMLNLELFLYWFTLIISLLGARYRDLYQLVPIMVALAFLLTPILYEKKNLGDLAWIADFNPFYRFLSPFRDALIQGEFKLDEAAVLLLVNSLGILLALLLLNRERKNLPFLI